MADRAERRRMKWCRRRVAPSRSTLRDESGIAIIIVVTVIAMLTIIVTEFTYSVTLDQFRVRNSLNALQSELMVRSGVNLAEGFLSLDEDEGVDTRSEEWYITMLQFCQHLTLPNGALVRCDVKDESGKINVNNTRKRGGIGADPTQVTREDILINALGCILQRREGLDVRIIDYLQEYWQREPPTLPDGTQRAAIPYFQSLEDFASTFHVPTRHLPYLRNYVTAQPPRRLQGVNINIVEPEVLGAILNPNPADGCALPPEAHDILERQLDPENPIRQVDVSGLLAGLEHAQLMTNLFVTKSSLYRIEASAITNPNPDFPTRSGVGKTLSVLVHRQCAERDGDACVRWTSKPLDWQKEGGARLFRERNRFSALSEYYGEFDPATAGELFQ